MPLPPLHLPTHSCAPMCCSSVLPVPFAISRTGVLMGLVTMLVVAFSNALTSILLLRAAGRTGHDTYEGVAEAAGGGLLKVGTEALQTHSYAAGL